MSAGKREFEFLLIGESRTGKTTLIQQLAHLPQTGPLLPTQGIHTYALDEAVDGLGTKVLFSDTCGLNHMKAEIFPCVETAQAVLLVYDVSRVSTFKAVQYWLYFWHGSQSGSSEKLLFLVGTMVDATHREVAFEEGAALAREYSTGFCEASLGATRDQRMLLLMLLEAAKSRDCWRKKKRRWLPLG